MNKVYKYIKAFLKANLHKRKMSRQKVEMHSTFRCNGKFRFSTSLFLLFKCRLPTFSPSFRLVEIIAITLFQ